MTGCCIIPVDRIYRCPMPDDGSEPPAGNGQMVLNQGMKAVFDRCLLVVDIVTAAEDDERIILRLDLVKIKKATDILKFRSQQANTRGLQMKFYGSFDQGYEERISILFPQQPEDIQDEIMGIVSDASEEKKRRKAEAGRCDRIVSRLASSVAKVFEILGLMICIVGDIVAGVYRVIRRRVRP